MRTDKVTDKKRPKTIADGHKILVILTPVQVEAARKIGCGSISAGIRRALDSGSNPEPAPVEK